jgi:hypothetical protein
MFVCLFRIVLRSQQYAFVLNIGIAYQGFGWETGGKEMICEDPDVDWRKILKCMFRKWDRRAWTGLIWLIIGTGGVLL